MEILHTIGTIFFLSTVLDFFAAQKITKFLKGQTQCSTKCKSGYLTTSDTCVFNYEISFKEALPETSSLILEIWEAYSEVFNPLITLKVMTDCTGFSKDADFYCTEIDSNVYIITINANELSRYSPAEIRACTVTVNQKNVYSDILAFPQIQIFDPLNSTGHLKINGKNMSTDFCNTTIDVSDLILEFDCVSAAKPCVIEMQVNGDTVVKQSENHAFFQGNYDNDKDVLVTIKYSACTLDGKFITISCSVFNGLIKHTTKDNSNNDIAIGVTVPLACIFVVATISFLIYRFVTKRKKTEETTDLTMTESFIKHEEENTSKKQNINQTDKEGFTALMLASENDCINIVKKLVTSGANVNQKNKEGWTALMLAANDNNEAIVQYLVDHGAADETEARNGRNALMIATYKRYDNIVSIIIQQKPENYQYEMIKKSDFKKVSKSVDNTIAHCMLDFEIIKQASEHLYSNSGKMDETNANRLHNSFESQGTLILDKAEKDKTSLKSLWLASKTGQFQLVEKLLNEGKKVNKRNKKGWTALMESTRYGHADIVKLLIQHKADVNIRNKSDSTALMLAAQFGHTDIALRLIENGALVNSKQKDGWTALIIASYYGHYEIVKQLIEHGANVNKTEAAGWNALMIVCQNGKVDICSLLIEKHADVNSIESSGGTALTIASQNGHTEIVKILISKEAGVNVKRNEGWSALMLACLSGYNETAQELINNKADVNTKENNGLTALMMASFHGHIDTVKILIDHGAKVSRMSNKGFTALMIASQRKHEQIVEMIIETEPTD